MPSGYLYILHNPAFPGLHKIGKTARTPEERAEELSGPSGLPFPYVVAFQRYVSDCDAAERELHSELVRYRVRQEREHFQVPLEKAIELVNRVADRFRATKEDGEEDISKDHPIPPHSAYIYVAIARGLQRRRIRVGVTTVPEEQLEEVLSQVLSREYRWHFGEKRKWTVLFKAPVSNRHEASRLIDRHLSTYEVAGVRGVFDLDITHAIEVAETIAAPREEAGFDSKDL